MNIYNDFQKAVKANNNLREHVQHELINILPKSKVLKFEGKNKPSLTFEGEIIPTEINEIYFLMYSFVVNFQGKGRKLLNELTPIEIGSLYFELNK